MGNLILSRKCGQKITIGNDVVLTVADIRGDKVKLAFEAPESVRWLHGSQRGDGDGRTISSCDAKFSEAICRAALMAHAAKGEPR